MGSLTYHNGRLVHGPYTKEVREHFLRRLLEVEKLVHTIGPKEAQSVPLITMEELRYIRKIWLDEFHEFDDTLPGIYEEVTGNKFDDPLIKKNKYFGAEESAILKAVCHELYPDETLLSEMQHAILDIEAKSTAIGNRRNILKNIEKSVKSAFYKNEEDAENLKRNREDSKQESIDEADDNMPD